MTNLFTCFLPSYLRKFSLKFLATLALFLSLGIGSVCGQVTLTYEWTVSAGKSSLPSGITHSGLGSDYSASNAPYYLKFDGTGDYIQIYTDDAALEVKFTVKMLGGSTTSKFKVQGCATSDGDFSDIQEFSCSGDQNDVKTFTTTNSIASTYRYFRICKSEHANGGNVGFGYLKITKAVKYTVRFYTASGVYTDLTEASVGAGVTPPSVPGTCGDWEFQGWSKSESDDDESTTVLSTETLTTGKYYPSANTTLYPVYTSTGNANVDVEILPTSFSSIGSNNYGSGAERTGSAGGVSLGAHYMTGNAANSPVNPCSAGIYLQCKASDANIYNKSAFSGYITKVVVNQYAAQAFSLYCGTSQLMASDNTSTGQTPSGTAQTAQSAATQMTWNVDIKDKYTFFDLKKGSTASYVSSIVVTYYGEVTLYYSYPTCCTALGSLNAAVSWTNPTEAVLKWNNILHTDSTWMVYYKEHSAGSWTSLWVDGSSDPISKTAGTDSEISVISDGGTNNKLKVTIEGLTCNTAYDFRIVAVPADGYCDKDTTLNNSNSGFNSGKWDLDYTFSGAALKDGDLDEGTGVLCGDLDITIEPLSLAYELPSDVTVTIGGDTKTKGTEYTWDSSTGELHIDEEDIDGTVAISCTATLVGCLNDPSIGAVSLKTGGTFNLGQVDVTVATSGTGSATCAWTDYGFVWSESACPTVGGSGCTKVPVGSSGNSTTWNGSLTKTSFATGTTYYYRAYGKNSKDDAAYKYSSSDGAFTPRSVTFNSNGGSSVDTKYVNSGGTTSAPTAPTKTGYAFDSWCTTSGLATAMDFSGTITKDTTLYAKWTANEYTVTLDKNYGSAGSSEVTATYGSAMPDMGTKPSRSGYAFTGYFDDPDDGEGKKYYNADKSSAATWDKAANTTLYAHWSANNYTVTLNNEGADTGHEGTDKIAVTYDSNTNLSGTPAITKPERDGYAFCGYYTDEDGAGVQIINGDGNVIASASGGGSTYTDASKNWKKADNVTLHAYWKQVYTVTWSVNDDTWSSGVVTGNTSVISGEKVSALPTAPTRVDCDDKKKFVGWRATEIDGNSVSNPGSIFTTQAGSPDITDDITFYAVFADVTGGDAIELTFPDDNSSSNGLTSQQYTSTWTAKSGDYSWSISNFNNNNWAGGWTNIRCGVKSTASTATITTSDAIGIRVDSIYLTMDNIGVSGVDTMKLYIDDNSSFSSPVVMGVKKQATTHGLKIASPAKDQYYKFEFTCNNSYSSANGYVQISKIIYKQKFDTANYVTTCAACTAAPTFNATPAVTKIGCDSAIVTATSGLATLGTGEGCHVREYGFVWGTTSTPTVKSNSGKYTVSDNIDEDVEFACEMDELTSGTQYYVRAYAINKYDTAYSTAQSFYTRGVSSIAITTAPSRTKYIAGEKFDPTGMVVTATMPNGDTEDVTADCTFSPDTETALTTLNTGVTVGYSPCSEDLSKTQAINVYSMTVSEGTNASYGEYSYSTGATFSVTPSSGKTYTLAVTNGTAVDNLDGTHTIINPTGNVTVTINYRDASTVKVYYKVDGVTVITQDVTESTTATLPSASDVATALAANDLELPEGTIYTNLWGWSESEFTPQTEEPTIVNSPTINATKTFYAVYTNMNKIRIDESNITSGSYPSSEQTLTISSVGFKYHYICKQTSNLQFQKAASNCGYLYNTSALGYIRKVEVGASGSNDNVPVYAGSAANTISGSALEDANTSRYKYVYVFPDNTQYFIVKGDNSYTYKVNYIDVMYSSATPYYMTTFCDDKIDAPTVTATKLSTASNKATITLSWGEVSGATGYKVKWGSISNDWEDVGAERTYVKENVSTGTVKWFVKAKYDEEDNCGAEIEKGSTTVNTAYSVTYDANTTGYTGDVPAVSWFEPSLSVTVSTNELAKSRYHWDGWTPYNFSTDAEITVTTGAFTMPSANVTVKGGWTEVLSGDEVYITSAKDITTMSSMDIAVERATYKSGTMTISNQTGDQGGTFHAVIDGATADATDGLNATVKIEYTPSKANVTESATMTAVIGSESYNFTVYGRSLPEDFVIVAKVGAAWTALPADATSAGLQQGYSLTLDNTTTPTKATLAPASAVFNYYAKSTKTTDYIRLAGKDNSKALWGNATTNIKMNAAIGGGYATGAPYEWQLTTTDNATYTLHNDNSNRYLGVNNDKKWGTHAAGNTASKVLYFLPVDATAAHIGMTVSSWGETSFTFTPSVAIPSHDHVAVECNGDSYSATMSGSGPYTITISEMDFSEYSGASLVVQWISDEDVVLAQGAVLLPIFITGDNTDFSGYDPDILSTTDIHVIDGATLTITSNVSVHDMAIEGGSTLVVDTTAGGAAVTFSMNSLHLEGGWSDVGGSSTYDMPRVYINPKSTLTKTTGTVNLDLSVDSRNYYPFAVPFEVDMANVRYVNDVLHAAAEYGKHYVIKEYRGAIRAEYGAVDSTWAVVPHTAGTKLQPGKGYILTAVSVPAYGGGVIRFPMSFTNAWTAKGEQATVSDVTKNVISVTHHTGAATSGGGAAKRHEGWNMLGVPFMSCYTSGTDMYDGVGSADLMKGRMTLSGDPADPYGWESGDVVYVSVPTHDFSEYIQTDITSAKLVPGWSFFIQVGETGNLTFLTTKQREDSDMPIYAPQRTEEERKPVIKTGIILSGNEANDKTTLLISDRYNSDYEIGADLEKMFGNGYTLATYSINNGTRLAFNAMSTSDAKQLIPIGVRFPEDGEYTFSLNERYADADIEHLDLIDYETGVVTNLMVEDYTFTATREQNDNRFALNVQQAMQTPTDIGSTPPDKPDRTRKIILNDVLYIVRDGLLYDATGKRVTTINR